MKPIGAPDLVGVVVDGPAGLEQGRVDVLVAQHFEDLRHADPGAVAVSRWL